MFAHERHAAIKTLLLQQRKLSVLQLQEALQVSPATLRRDLSELEARGAVVRVRGAVVHPSYFRSEPSLAEKSRAAAGAKRSIAQAAADLVPQNATVLLDAGSTCLALGRLLVSRPGTTIFTNSLAVAALAQEQESPARVICLGGEVRTVSGALVGALASSWLAHIRTEWAFLSASGLHPEEGASTTELSEASLKAEFLKRAEHCVLLADVRKWAKPAAVTFAPWDAFHTWVTDAPAQVAELVQSRGANVISIKEETT